MFVNWRRDCLLDCSQVQLVSFIVLGTWNCSEHGEECVRDWERDVHRKQATEGAEAVALRVLWRSGVFILHCASWSRLCFVCHCEVSVRVPCIIIYYFYVFQSEFVLTAVQSWNRLTSDNGIKIFVWSDSANHLIRKTLCKPWLHSKRKYGPPKLWDYNPQVFEKFLAMYLFNFASAKPS